MTAQAIRTSLVAAARRYSRVAHEVEDLAHDLVVSALRRGVLASPEFLRSIHGAARRHGAFLARSAERRRAREAHAVPVEVAVEEAPEGASLSVLSPALQTTLLLLAAGLEKAELHIALGVTDAALRKRFQALRASAPLARPAVVRTEIPRQLRRVQVSALPRLAASRALATSDPDGHGLILTFGGGTATGR
jgi:DNA-directed RNA polymerase specialized sigma24 family protein